MFQPDVRNGFGLESFKEGPPNNEGKKQLSIIFPLHLSGKYKKKKIVSQFINMTWDPVRKMFLTCKVSFSLSFFPAQDYILDLINLCN